PSARAFYTRWPTCSSPTARSSPSSSPATSARRLVGQGRARPGGRELPLLRLRDRLDRRPLQPGRRLAPLLLVEGAGRRLRPDRAVELPADDDHLEARARPRSRLHDRAQARLRDAAFGAADGRACDRGFPPGTINVVPGPG